MQERMQRIFGQATRRTEFIARHIWSIARLFLKPYLTPRCRQCILPRSHSALNAQGLCPWCENPRKDSSAPAETHAGESADDLIRQGTGKGTGMFDALIMVSGGKDSVYLADQIKSRHAGLRTLALTVDNGFMSPYALENCQSAMRKLALPHLLYKVEPNFARSAFRYALQMLPRQTGYSLVDTVDACIIFDSARMMADSLGIPLILSGIGPVQSQTIYGKAFFELSLDDQWRPLKEIGMDFSRAQSTREFEQWYRPRSERPARLLFPFVEWDPAETEIIEYVTGKGLIGKHQSSPLMTNNLLIPVIAMAESAHFGYCSWEVEFARMIREGKSDRPYWRNLYEMLEFGTRTGAFVNKTVENTLKELGMTIADIRKGTSTASRTSRRLAPEENGS